MKKCKKNTKRKNSLRDIKVYRKDHVFIIGMINSYKNGKISRKNEVEFNPFLMTPVFSFSLLTC